MADGVWGGSLLDEYAVRVPDVLLVVPLPDVEKSGSAVHADRDVPRFLAPHETLDSSSFEKVISSDPQNHTVMRTRRCDGRNCTETTQVYGAGEKLLDEEPNFDRDFVDHRLATVSQEMAEELERMHRSFGANLDDMFRDFSASPVDEGTASSFDAHRLPEAPANVTGHSTSMSRVTEMSNGHVITRSRSCKDGHCVENVTESTVEDEVPSAKMH
jgi:hypothetical protein